MRSVQVITSALPRQAGSGTESGRSSTGNSALRCQRASRCRGARRRAWKLRSALMIRLPLRAWDLIHCARGAAALPRCCQRCCCRSMAVCSRGRARDGAPAGVLARAGRAPVPRRPSAARCWRRNLVALAAHSAVKEHLPRFLGRTSIVLFLSLGGGPCRLNRVGATALVHNSLKLAPDSRAPAARTARPPAAPRSRPPAWPRPCARGRFQQFQQVEQHRQLQSRLQAVPIPVRRPSCWASSSPSPPSALVWPRARLAGSPDRSTAPSVAAPAVPRWATTSSTWWRRRASPLSGHLAPFSVLRRTEPRRRWACECPRARRRRRTAPAGLLRYAVPAWGLLGLLCLAAARPPPGLRSPHCSLGPSFTGGHRLPARGKHSDHPASPICCPPTCCRPKMRPEARRLRSSDAYRQRRRHPGPRPGPRRSWGGWRTRCPSARGAVPGHHQGRRGGWSAPPATGSHSYTPTASKATEPAPAGGCGGPAGRGGREQPDPAGPPARVPRPASGVLAPVDNLRRPRPRPGGRLGSRTWASGWPWILDLPLGQLRNGERLGQLPSLVLSPMLSSRTAAAWWAAAGPCGR